MTSGTSYNQEMNFMVSTTNGNYEPYTGGQPSPSPKYPQEIKTIENSLKIILNNGELEDSENYLFSQIQANLPEGEFIGKINDTYKDTLKLEYNEDDGQYHLKLYKNVGKFNFTFLEVSQNGIDGNIFHYITPTVENALANYNDKCVSTHCDFNKSHGITPLKKMRGYIDLHLLNLSAGATTTEAIIKLKELYGNDNVISYYPLETPYIVDLGVVDKLIPFEGINNIKVLAELEPSKIKTTYYIDAKKYIEDTTSALLELGGEN